MLKLYAIFLTVFLHPRIHPAITAIFQPVAAKASNVCQIAFARGAPHRWRAIFWHPFMFVGAALIRVGTVQLVLRSASIQQLLTIAWCLEDRTWADVVRQPRRPTFA